MIVAAAPVVRAQEDQRVGARLDSATRITVMHAIEVARGEGLPVEPLVNKALEGATKRAPGPRIQAAVDTLLRRLELSRDALAPEPSARDIAAGADALAYGATRESLARMRAIRPRGSVAVPLGVLTQLVASGVPVSRATRVVADLVRRGARDEQLIALSDDVRWYVAAGASPEAALDVRMRGLNAALPPAPATGAAGDAAAPFGLSSTGKKKP